MTTEHAADCLSRVKPRSVDPARPYELSCTCAAKERARIAELQLTLSVVAGECWKALSCPAGEIEPVAMAVGAAKRIAELEAKLDALPEVGEPYRGRGTWWERDHVSVELASDNRITVGGDDGMKSSDARWLAVVLLRAVDEAEKVSGGE